MAKLGPFVSAHRMVRDYVSGLYGPAAIAAAERSADNYAGARTIAAWRRHVIDSWHHVHVDEVEASESVADLSSTRTVRARVALGPLSAGEVEVQLVHGAVGQAAQLEGAHTTKMTPEESSDGHVTYVAELPLNATVMSLQIAFGFCISLTVMVNEQVIVLPLPSVASY